MTCPRCSAEFEQDLRLCPGCGVHLLRNVSGMIKTSVVMIAACGERGFYSSVQDVPEPLRRQLLRVTASDNSETIIIADKSVKEQITQVVARQESNRDQPSDSTRRIGTSPRVSRQLSEMPSQRTRLSERPFLGLSWITWAGIFLACGSAGVVAAVFAIHW